MNKIEEIEKAFDKRFPDNIHHAIKIVSPAPSEMIISARDKLCHKSSHNHDIKLFYRQAFIELIEEIREWGLDERDNVAIDANAFNNLNDDYKEGYYIAMNTLVKKLDSLLESYKIKE